MDSTQGGFRVAQETHPALLQATRQSADSLLASEGPCLLPPGISDLAFQGSDLTGEQPRTLWRLEPVCSAP